MWEMWGVCFLRSFWMVRVRDAVRCCLFFVFLLVLISPALQMREEGIDDIMSGIHRGEG